MLAGTALFSINDALGKWLLATYSVGELLLVRSVTALILLVPFVYQVGITAFTGAPRRPLQLLRIQCTRCPRKVAIWYEGEGATPMEASVVPSQLRELGQQALTDVRIGVANRDRLCGASFSHRSFMKR
jgi:hypothetical protein